MRTPTICDACTHLDRGYTGDVTDAPQPCVAFPHGIPVEIWCGGIDHRSAYDGDHGVRFALKPGKDAVLRAWEHRTMITT